MFLHVLACFSPQSVVKVCSFRLLFSSQLLLVIYLLRFVFLLGIRGALMDDAMILPCGHSFGSGGIEHILRVVSYWQEYYC